jgi:hypothetical protein
MVLIAQAPSRKARIAGVFYLLNIATGASALVLVNGRLAALTAATLCYVVVTLIFFDLFRPVNQRLSLVAALFSFAGCIVGMLSPFHLIADQINSLVFFGLYCLTIGYLIFRSTFLPRSLGALMAFGGVGWLTFLSPALARSLMPFNMLPGILGEASLTLWLLAKGVNAQRWEEMATKVSKSALLSATYFL